MEKKHKTQIMFLTIAKRWSIKTAKRVSHRVEMPNEQGIIRGWPDVLISLGCDILAPFIYDSMPVCMRNYMVTPCLWKTEFRYKEENREDIPEGSKWRL